MKTRTKLTHIGRNCFKQYPEFSNRDIVNPPIYKASTIVFQHLDDFYCKNGKDQGNRFRYGLKGTPTMIALEEGICALENSDHCRLLSSGLAAITHAMLSFVKAGAHILITDSAYEPTRSMCEGFLKRMGVESEYYPPTIGVDIEKYIRPNTALILLESPGSLTFEIQDVPAITQVARAHNIPTIIDNTWSAGYFYKPLDHGVDLSLQAVTKYISGHSDLLMGSVAYNDGPYADIITKTWEEIGCSSCADDMYQTLKSLHTLPVRIEAQQQAGLEMAHWLEAHDMVEAVIHPALPSHPQHDLWKRDFTGACSLFAFTLKENNYEKMKAMMDHMDYFRMGFSWGGYESLLIPFKTKNIRNHDDWQHKGQPFRIHVGQEDPDDLIEDLEKGFERWKKA